MLASGVHLTTVECAYGERPYEIPDRDGVQMVRVRASGSALVWAKENLLNCGIARLPPEAKYIATADADISFMSPTWAEDTVHALQHYDVVQPWSDCYDLGPKGEHLAAHRSFARLAWEGKPMRQGGDQTTSPYQLGHPGYVWAWRRTALDGVGGLIETGAAGAGDHHMALAMIGRVKESYPQTLTQGYKDPLLIWQQRAERHIVRNIGYVPGTIMHYWHGRKSNRFYFSRWKVLEQNQFTPATDLKRNTYGVLELSGNKPALRVALDRYFRSRNEDGTDME
jgi:hypothetical protein